MRTPERVVIVGASIGGLTVAETLREEGFAGEITLLGDETRLPYARPPLSKQILAGEWEPEQAAIRTASELDLLDIRVLTGRRATGLDVDARILHTADGPLAFDELVIATGTQPRPHPVLPEASTLRTMDDALRLRERMDAAGRVAVIGSGILGSEIASAARKRDSEVLLVGRSGALGFGGVGTLLSEELSRLHLAHGIELALRAEVTAARPAGAGAAELTFDDGSTRAFDLVVTMIGGTPCTEWLVSSTLDLANGIACDPFGVAAPGISAVGDVAAWLDPITGCHRRVEHQSNAIEQAIAVAGRIAHGAERAQPVPLFWSEIHGTRIHAYGWFDPERPLAELPKTSDSTGTVYSSHDLAGELRGIVGWNAPPRDFRTARAAVVTTRPLVLHA
ncbi:NAD(P)/FAD-dependent oxidoreductase [Microbacterium immunditiarum]|uniref:NADPH-dependent 2,4-dienoyl-CoA reductase/sulfur reductase-like enzyme n=1 Tax=Microbacterium immunditiarum TaxID=337480 RepID=A0A7Y9GK48_9MICO|nr:FAD/NAD(P)-binding oxidoreductase [Microbacterium immunditiarum]NYE18002.1 NADPH-dependent 2,4-dienoyl-CoA reductase/sulfur reductase-like enzyme [Microbacterium immunditiarum]